MPIKSSDELGPMIAAFNRMTSSLDISLSSIVFCGRVDLTQKVC